MLIRLFIKSTVAALACCIAANAHAQDIDLAVFSGYGGYSLKELKRHRSELLSDIPVKMRVNDDFPGFIIFGGTLRVNFEDTALGCSFRLGSTGSRASYSDYSGQLVLDQKVNYVSFGAEAGSFFYTSEKFDVKGVFRYWLNFNHIDFVSSTSYFNQPAEEAQVGFISITSAIAPSIVVDYKINKFKIFADVGYEIQIPAKMKLDLNNDVFLIDKEGKEVKFDASGARINIGIAINLKKNY